jgi:CheY-like chemotaxis protein
VTPRVLVFTQDGADLEPVCELLRTEFPQLTAVTDVAPATDALCSGAADVIVICCLSASGAERAYRSLYRHVLEGRISPHSTLVLCRAQDAPQVYSLCRDGTFDDYVVDKPLHDPGRLKLSVWQLYERTSAAVVETARRQRVKGQLGQLRDSATGHVEELRHRVRSGSTEVERRLADAIATLPERLGELAQRVNGPDLNALRTVLTRLGEEALSPALAQFCASIDSLANEWQQRHEVPSELVQNIREDLVEDSARRTRTVLVVDDTASFRTIARDMLNAMGLRAIEAPSGTAALALMHREHPRLVLLDYDMPDMDGLAVARAVRESPQLRATPIIMLTGLGTRDLVLDARATGIEEFLVKPIRFDLLKEKVNRLLRNAPPGTGENA